MLNIKAAVFWSVRQRARRYDTEYGCINVLRHYYYYYHHYYNYTYLLIPWSTVLLEMLTGFQLAKKFPTFYVTRRFNTAFTSARHLSLF